MTSADNTAADLREELIRRVTALDGKQATIDSNRKTLAATVEALAECTNVDLASIQSVADTLSVRPEYVSVSADTAEQASNEKRNKQVKFAVITVVVLFAFSLFKWMNVNSSINNVMHDVSQLQSRIADFYMRTGHYPFEFSQVGYLQGPPNLESAKSIEMGPHGQLLINTNGVFSGQILLSPDGRSDGRSKWQCSTDTSWIFTISSWLCGYSLSVQFNHL
ncbi:MAG: hypothetical protein AAF404_06885 [Pseudomonadota bacterium]